MTTRPTHVVYQGQLSGFRSWVHSRKETQRLTMSSIVSWHNNCGCNCQRRSLHYKAITLNIGNQWEMISVVCCLCLGGGLRLWTIIVLNLSAMRSRLSPLPPKYLSCFMEKNKTEIEFRGHILELHIYKWSEYKNNYRFLFKHTVFYVSVILKGIVHISKKHCLIHRKLGLQKTPAPLFCFSRYC